MLFGCDRKSSEKKLIEIGSLKLDHNLDIRTLIETIRFVKIFRKGMLNSKQRILAKLTKTHYLESSSDASDADDFEKNMNLLVGYNISGEIDRSLLKQIYRSKAPN
jgi:hypothetical protein